MAMATCSRAACRTCWARQVRVSQGTSWDIRRLATVSIGLSSDSATGKSLTASSSRRASISVLSNKRPNTSLRFFSSSSSLRNGQSRQTGAPVSDSITVLGDAYMRDDYTNLSEAILARVGETPRLPKLASHPLNLLQRQIETSLPSFTAVTPPSPVVSVEDNFGKLGFPEDHPGRSPTDTYYINRDLCLRTHTSTHEVDTFAKGHMQWLLTADVFRRDEIDASHYPVFHQMEGASVRDISEYRDDGRVQHECEQMEERLRAAQIVIEDDVDLQEAGGFQAVHAQNPETQKAAALAMRHLKATLNNLVLDLFGERHAADVRSRAKGSAGSKTSTKDGDESSADDSLKVRWISAYFPFTSPSFEVEVWFRGEWLEILGCGVVQQRTLDEAGVKGKLGWAFGLGLERIAMVLFQIPDIRLFWSQDKRFLSQFAQLHTEPSTPAMTASSAATPSAGVSPAGGSQKGQKNTKLPLITFKPYSKYPPCYKDASFWLPNHASVHENDVFEVIRDVAGDLTETVVLIDDFVHPKTGRRSKCFRINYRSMDRSLENDEVNMLHARVTQRLVEQLSVELR